VGEFPHPEKKFSGLSKEDIRACNESDKARRKNSLSRRISSQRQRIRERANQGGPGMHKGAKLRWSAKAR